MTGIKKTIKLLSALMLVAALILCSSCSTFNGFDTAQINAVRNYENTAGDYCAYNKKTAEKLASSEAIELYFDKSSGGICVNSLYSDGSFTSLPEFSNNFAAGFIVNVLFEDKLYTLDTSACCASKNSITAEKYDDGAKITYKLTAESVFVELPVVFKVSGSLMEVSCELSECKASENVRILSVQFMPYFGAVRYNAQDIDYSVFGDWFLVPDGVGALMFTAAEDEKSALTFSVYGKDFYEDTIPAGVGAYGIKNRAGVLAATICDGEENALIRVFRAGADGKNINRIYPEFIITPISGAQGNVKTGSSYSGRIAVEYEFLSSSDSDYVDVAAAVRQSLIRAGIMSAEKCEDVYPLTVSFVAGTDGSRKTTAATLQQAENLLSMLKDKGVNEIDMIISGAFSGGLEASFADGLSVSSAVGSRQELEELLSFAHSQKLDIYAGANLISGKEILASKGISGTVNAVEIKNPLSPYIGKEGYTLKYYNADKIEKGTNRALGFLEKYNFAGVSVNDAMYAMNESADSADGLYTGYNNMLQGNLSAISAHSKLMLCGSSMNIVKYADRLCNVAFEAISEPTGSYAAVPFVPVILHGSVIYSGNAVNSDAVSRINLLKAVEYGAAVHYVWVSDERSDKHYEYTINEAVEFMLDAKERLADLSSKRITEHFMYESGVYCTGYEGGIRVYVNYNNYSVIIGEVAVMPYDFLRIG